MIDLRSWPKEWNAANLRRLATWPENPAATLKRLAAWPENSADTLRRLAPFPKSSSSRGWPLVGMFAIGVFAGAIGYYAVTQRSQIRRLATRAFVGDEPAVPDGGDKVAKPVSVTSHRSNHRRKAASEVS